MDRQDGNHDPFPAAKIAIPGQMLAKSSMFSR
jgi:hypothetical protein